MKLWRSISNFLNLTHSETKDAVISFFLRFHRKLVFIGTVILLCIILLLGWLTIRKVTEVVSEEFNQQQLVIARHTADQISHHLEMLRRELTLLSLSPAIQYYEKASLGRRMAITYATLKEEAVKEIRYINSSNSTMHIINDKGYSASVPYSSDSFYIEWAAELANRGSFMMSDIYNPHESSESQTLYVKMATPVWQISADDSHPVPSNKFAGVLVILVDVTRLIESRVANITSGKTGYAWVINNDGIFLYHKKKEFVGKNAFEARQEKAPKISFARINEIQKKMMLTGKEGTSWFITGWHGGEEGAIKKLIAFAPIKLEAITDQRIWSVAVVAPVSEVEGAIHDIQLRQFMLYAVIVCLILFTAMSVIMIEAKWSASLKEEVDRQTSEYRKSEQRYRSLVEHAEDIIFTMDTNGVFLSINSFGAKFFGSKPELIIGRPVIEFFQASTGELIYNTIHEVITQKRGQQLTFMMRRNNRDYWLNANLRRLLDKSGSVYAILGIVRDMTDHMKMEEQSYYTEKMASLGTLAAGVAHEINNPLAIILGFSDLLKEKAAVGSEDQEMLTSIERQALKAKKVVENLLSIARKKDHADVELNINTCIEDVLRVLSNNLFVNKVSLPHLDLAPSLPNVKGDPDELQQVILNIINNALYVIKNNGGELSIGTELSSDSKDVEIRISDTGPGIAKEHRSRIFDPLFTTKKVGDGTGLGLSVSYGIIKRHGGIITFDTATKDESERTGTTFFITLPAVSNKEADKLSGKS